MQKSIRVRFLGKDYTLRVEVDDELATIEMAAYLESKLQAFKTEHPEQSDLTVAVITALAITEDLFMEQSSNMDPGDAANSALDEMERSLSRALLTA
jgi:cell division protein ZapA